MEGAAVIADRCLIEVTRFARTLRKSGEKHTSFEKFSRDIQPYMCYSGKGVFSGERASIENPNTA